MLHSRVFYRFIFIGLFVVLLPACGNKGDLFLLPTEATVEELESIDEAIDAIDQEVDEATDDVSDSEKKKNKEN